MGKIFTATEKFSDVWYFGLCPNTKLCLEYMHSTCDIAGVWEPNFEEAEYRIGFLRVGTTIDWNDVFEELNRIPAPRFEMKQELLEGVEPEAPKTKVPHVLILKNGKWWLPRFIIFQNGGGAERPLLLSEQTPRHIPILKSLWANGITDRFAQYFPGCITEALTKRPPKGLDRKGRPPTLDECKGWDEARELPENEVRLFFYTYESKGWRIDGERIDNPRALMGKWSERFRKSRDESWKTETPGQLKIRIEAIDEHILKLGKPPHTHRPEGKLHEEPTPEAMTEIKRLRKLKSAYEAAIREKSGK